MKYSFFFFVLLFSLFLSCNKSDDPGRGVDLVFRKQFEIPAGLGVFDVHHFYLRDVPTHFASTLALANITADQVARVTTTEGNLSGVFGDANLDFIDRVSVRVYTNDPADYLEVGYRDPAPIDPGNAMGLIPSLADSKEFISAATVNFDVVFWLRRTTTEVSPVQLDMTLRALY